MRLRTNTRAWVLTLAAIVIGTVMAVSQASFSFADDPTQPPPCCSTCNVNTPPATVTGDTTVQSQSPPDLCPPPPCCSTCNVNTPPATVTGDTTQPCTSVP